MEDRAPVSRTGRRSRTAPFVLCLVLLSAVPACTSTRPSNAARTSSIHARKPDAIEYVSAGRTHSVHVYMTATGAARVDLPYGNRQQPVRTVFLPTNAEEVRALVATVDALISSSSSAHGKEPPPPSRLDEGMYVRCTKGTRNRAVSVSSLELGRNHVWEGVGKEIEAVAHADLARAVIYHGIAEEIDREGDESPFWAYERAVQRFEDWAMSRSSRYGATWEPETEMAFRYPDADDDQQRWTIRGVPREVTELPGITEEWAIKLLQYAWEMYTSGLIFARDEDTTIVSLDEGGVRGFYNWSWAGPPQQGEIRHRHPCGLSKETITPTEIETLKRAEPALWE